MATPPPQNPSLAPLLRETYRPSDLLELRQHLDRSDTLTIQPMASGLFSAAQTTEFSQGTNYHASWVRDNVHVAFAHYTNGKTEVAAKAATALTNFFHTQQQRFRDIIATPSLKVEAQRRPHIRFDGGTLTELSQTRSGRICGSTARWL
jgi:phosphorylase kinase alpha/beta subunit